MISMHKRKKILLAGGVIACVLLILGGGIFAYNADKPKSGTTSVPSTVPVDKSSLSKKSMKHLSDRIRGISQIGHGLIISVKCKLLKMSSIVLLPHKLK